MSRILAICTDFSSPSLFDCFAVHQASHTVPPILYSTLLGSTLIFQQNLFAYLPTLSWRQCFRRLGKISHNDLTPGLPTQVPFRLWRNTMQQFEPSAALHGFDWNLELRKRSGIVDGRVGQYKSAHGQVVAALSFAHYELEEVRGYSHVWRRSDHFIAHTELVVAVLLWKVERPRQNTHAVVPRGKTTHKVF